MGEGDPVNCGCEFVGRSRQGVRFSFVFVGRPDDGEDLRSRSQVVIGGSIGKGAIVFAAFLQGIRLTYEDAMDAKVNAENLRTVEAGA
jgi:hypothetical protein